MKRNQVNDIFYEDANRNKKIISYLCLIFVIFVISLTFFILYFNDNKPKYVSYKEKSNIDYTVHLKDNDFFETEILPSNNQYISTLIDYITSDFNYGMYLDEQDVKYKYSYKVVAKVDVKDKITGLSLYNFSEDLVKEAEYNSNEKFVGIHEQVNIDYNRYNDLIKKFVALYDIEDSVSTLKVSLYVRVIGSCEDFNEDSENESVMTLTIPLTEKTMAIELNNDLIDTDNNVMLCVSPSRYTVLFLVVAGLVLVIDILIIIRLIVYSRSTRNAKTIYEKELKKILSNYKSYIQKVNNNFDLKGYQALKVDTFTDMLEIRDTIQQPILMVENNEKTGVYFIIPSNTKILYMYGIKISDIEKRLRNKKNN